ncbi:MAG TPA: RNA methyltransferase [Parafilimonas sp.]|nr:RNA methyltransferase [Parafilimonas sp.]
MLSRNEAKYIQSLYHKKNRDAEEMFVAEGVKLVGELLRSGLKIYKIYALQKWIDHNADVDDAVVVTETELKKISGFETPNEVIAIAGKKAEVAVPDLKGKITLLLDGIQDPGNMGTIIRTAHWFGIQNIIAANDSADVYNPKVIQASMGSFLHVNIFYRDLKIFLSENTIPVYGTVLNGEDISMLARPDECVLIIGNESKGIRPDIIGFVEKKITIKRIGAAESLNAAIAAGIILWRFCNR